MLHLVSKSPIRSVKFDEVRTRALEQLVQGAPLQEVLTVIALAMEGYRPGMLCSILVLDQEKRRLQHGAAPSLPEFYNNAIHDTEIGPNVGSCGAAAYSGGRVIAENIQTHPNWKEYRGLAAQAGLASCWSAAICKKNKQVLGTFAIYHRTPRSPNESDWKLIDDCAALVAVVIEHCQLEERRTLAERQLRESEERFRFLSDNAPVMIWLDGPDGEGIYYNKVWLDFTGRTLEQEHGYGWTEVLHPEDRDVFWTGYANARKLRTRFTSEYRMRRHDGQYRWVLDTGVARHDSSGNYLGYVGTSVDITDRKRREHLLRTAAEGNPVLRGPEFFKELVRALGAALEVDLALIGMLNSAGTHIETQAVFVRGQLVGNYQFELAGKPCTQVLSSGSCNFASGVSDVFPEDDRLRKMGIESFCGVAIRNAYSGERGVLIVGHSQPMDSPSEFLALLTVFGNYASTELERQSHEADLQLAAHSFETQQEGIMIVDANGIIRRVNKAFTDITGYASQDAVGQNPRILKSSRHDPDFHMDFWHSVATTGRWQGEIWNRRKQGKEFPCWLSVAAVRDHDNKITHYVGTLVDLTERKQAEAEITRLAYFDDLTALPNRRLLMNRIEQSLALANRSGFYGAVVFVDLDHFKNLNDGKGHAIGDVLLKQVARRLETHLRTEDTVARLGGDEFVILLANLGVSMVTAATQASLVAEKIRETINEDYDLGSYRHEVTASIGVALFPESNEDVDELLKRADTAMYRAKADGRNCVRFYEAGMQASAEARLAIDRDLRSALRSDKQLTLVFQPKYDADGAICGAEALLRWHHPTRGLIMPLEFVSIAEETGLIVPIGEQALAQACAHFASIQGQLPKPLQVSVNVSARQLQQAEFVERVKAIVKQSGLAPSLLTIELTEGMVVQNIEGTIEKMSALKEFGVRFSIDDFGTGYSSLAYLKRLPLDELKIDRSFTNDVTVDPDDAALVETILSVARHFKLQVVAEGVENEEQLRFLREHKCTGYQGFYFSRPVSFSELIQLTCISS